jgi:oligo-1,6-glucosidase
MQWDATPLVGFTTGTPWLAINPNRSWLNAAAQVDDPASVFAHYRALIQLRHDLPVLAEGDFAGLLENDPDLWAYVRVADRQRLLVIANCSRAPREVEVGDGWTGARMLLGNLPGTAQTLEGDRIRLAAWEARIYLAE